MHINLAECILITNEQYCQMNEMVFQGQTRPNSVGIYYTVWFAEGVYYKIANSL